MMQQPYQGMPAQGHQQNEQHVKDMHNMCSQYHLYFIQVQMMDGSMHEGIIEDVDQEGVSLLMPEEDDGQNPYHDQPGYEGQQAQQSHFGYGYGGFGGGFAPGYGYGPGFGYGPGYGRGVPRRFRRFRRRRYPFYGIRSLFFPFFF